MELVDGLLALLTTLLVGLTTWNLKTTNSLQIRQSVNEALDKSQYKETDRRLKELAFRIEAGRVDVESKHKAVLEALGELNEKFSMIHEDLTVIKASCAPRDR